MSSRNRRNRGEKNDDPFGTSVPSAEEVDKLGYSGEIMNENTMDGPLSKALARGMTVKNIPLDQIIPDPRQPRHVIRFRVQQAWEGEEMATLFSTWERLIHDENGDTSFSIIELIEKADELGPGEENGIIPADATEDTERVTRNQQPKPLEAALLKIIDLAASIRREDLTNPITVASHGIGYMIETGERRWLAFNLLYKLTEDVKWKKIPARTIEGFKPDVWRQATENNARDDLNAIGKARQLALLTMDLWEREEGSRRRVFQPIEAFEKEQDFYKQAKDGHPYGKGELLLSAMGAKNMSTIKRYRDLLNLPNDIWQMADDTNCPESILRRIVSENDYNRKLSIFNTWYMQNFAIGKIPNHPTRQKTDYFMRFQEEYIRIENTVDSLDEEEAKAAILMLENLLHLLKGRFKG